MPRPYEGLIGETVRIAGANGDAIEAYSVRPMGAGPFPGVIVIHEAMGLVIHTKEMARKFAAAGYVVIAPDLYSREGFAHEGQIDFTDPAQRRAVMQAGGATSDARAIGDLEGAATYLKSLPQHNGKIGVIGHCSGGRHTLLFACNTQSVQAAVDCYGGQVVVDDPATQLSEGRPKAVVDMVENLNCPLLGLFGVEDQNPSPAHTERLDAELKKHNKTAELQTYPDAGHGFFADYRPSYRQASAVDGWERIFDFYRRNLS